MVKITYFILKIIELAIFYIYGKRISMSKSKYWNLVTIPILAYSIVEGLRFGRQIDWNGYYFRYNILGRNIGSLEYEPLFRYICHILYHMGIPYYGFIFIQCLFFVTSAFVLMKRFRADCKWMLPLILVCSTGNEMFIRWFLAFSFILLSMNDFIGKKYLRSCVWVLCGFLCHSGIIVIVAIVILLGCIRNMAIPPIAGVVLLFLSTFVLSLESMLFIANFASLISPTLGDYLTVGSYIEKTESILSGSFGNVGIMERSLLKDVGSFIAYAPVILWGKKYMVEYKYGLVFYNLFVIGAIGAPLFTVEIFNRIFAACLFFFYITGGIFYAKTIEQKKQVPKIVFAISILSLLFALSPHVWDALNRDAKEALFIWDANGRNYLPF